MANENVLETELQFFNKNRKEWLKIYENQYALIKQKELLATYTTEE